MATMFKMVSSGIRALTLSAAAILCANPALAGQAAPEFRQHPFLQFDIEANRSADITLADVDADGDFDVIVANGRHWAQQDFVFFNSGNGMLLEAVPLGEKQTASYTVQTGDLDGDGDLDAIVVRDRLPALSFLNDGHGSFVLLGEIAESAGSARSATMLDADGDGALDLVIVTRRAPDRLYRGNGRGGFYAGSDLPGDGFGSTGVAAGDIDGNGSADLIIARRDGGASAIMLNDGAGNFSEQFLPGSEGDHRKSALADFNGDGRLDVVLASTDGRHLLFLQSAQGAFEQASAFGDESDAVQALCAGDIDGDGDIDLIAGADGPNLVFLNDGTGQFARQIIPGEADTYGAAIGDMNGDGLLDIVFANSGSANEVVLSIPADDGARNQE